MGPVPMEGAGMDLTELANRHYGQTVWVVASDSSLGYFPDGFFDQRAVITINQPHVPSQYCVTKNDAGDEWVQSLIDQHPRTLFVASEYRYGNLNHQRSVLNGATVFSHRQNRVSLFDPRTDIPDQDGMLLVSYSTVGSALHLAAYMGARTCMVVGASGGAFGGQLYHEAEYHPGHLTHLVSDTSKQTQGICDELQRRYGTYFVTVLPWANMRLGGVTFTSEYGQIN